MALVSYGISDSSDDEDGQNGVYHSKSTGTSQSTVRSSIPPPKSWSLTLPENISFLNAFERTRPVRILAPPLLQDVGEPPKKTMKKTSGRGLVAVLPQPSLSRHDLLPYDENKNSKERDVDSSLDSSQLHSIEASLPSFFFSPSTEAIEESRDHESMLQGYSTIENPGLQTSEPSPSSSLNSNDLFKLCGSQGKHLSSEMIRLIEIDGSKLANSSELKTNNMKSLTYDYNALYRQHKFKSSRRERTKHQITYLVEHAKFFEREVTNYPKNSKISQKRYGF